MNLSEFVPGVWSATLAIPGMLAYSKLASQSAFFPEWVTGTCLTVNIGYAETMRTKREKKFIE